MLNLIKLLDCVEKEELVSITIATRQSLLYGGVALEPNGQ